MIFQSNPVRCATAGIGSFRGGAFAFEVRARRSILAGLIIPLAIGLNGVADDIPPESARKEVGAHDYAPGVRIDWAQRRVEMSAKVVLRKGPLELLVCSPQTREHESIFVAEARPLHIYQALGLIGLEPGSPVRYDDKSEQWLPPTGTPLRIDVRCDGGRDTVPASRMVRASGDDAMPKEMPWVFAGSTRDREGRFAADRDGTLVCVVDFESALITVGALHTSDNAQLWLEANADAIPPIGTKCTLLIGARDHDKSVIEILIDAKGGILIAGQSVSVEELAKRIAAEETKSKAPAVRLIVEDGADKVRVERIQRLLKEAGIDLRNDTQKDH